MPKQNHRPPLCSSSVLLKSSANAMPSQPHPMLIPVILSELFEYIPVKDLPSCRLVCKTWETSSRPQWRSKARLLIYGYSIGRASGDVNEWDDEQPPIAEFVDFLGSPQSELEHKLKSIPFSKISLVDGSGLHIPFFELYGSHVKDLHLNNYNADEREGYLLESDFKIDENDFRRILLKLTPMLEVLTIDGNLAGSLETNMEFMASGIDAFPEHEHLKVFHFDLWDGADRFYTGEHSLDSGFWLSHFPNLHTLKLARLHDSEGNTYGIPVDKVFQLFVDLMNTIARERKRSPNKLSITHFDTGNVLSVIKQPLLLLVDLFQRAALPLATLKIQLSKTNDELVADIRKLLRLHSSTLQTLHCSNYTDSYVCISAGNLFGDDVNYPNLREIKLMGILVVDWKVAQCMPNVETLDVPLTKDSFPTFCESWGGTLRELTIRQTFYLDDVDDETLTGIPRGWPKRHSRFLIKDRPPNITNLKVLERFNDMYYHIRFINHLVYWGFVHLPSLKTVFVNVPVEKVNISSANLSKLKKKNVTLKFRTKP